MDAPLEYHRLHRRGRPGPWRPFVGVLVLVLGVAVIAPLVALVPVVVWLLATGEPVGEGVSAVMELDDVTPMGLAYVNVVLASAIPITILLNLVLHGLTPDWLVSVARRVRWKFFLACFGLSVVALVATVVVSAFVPQDAAGELSTQPNAFTSTTRDFLLVVLLLTPLQAAGEEFAFRGYLMQAFGGLLPSQTASRVVAVLLSALLFALAHGAQDLPIFADRLAFGLVAGALVILTGGLEAAIAMHVLNNFFAFGLALAFTDMTSALNPTGGTWWSLPGTLTQSLVYLVLATMLARQMGLATTATPAVLEAPRGPM